MIAAETIEEFYREGYVVIPQLVPTNAIEAVLAAAPTEFQSGGEWTPKVFQPEEPMKDAGIHRLLVEPNLVAAAEALLEAEAQVYYGMLAVVPAGGGRGLAWHQDNMYHTVLGRALNIFIALGDIEQNMAQLWVAPQSHRHGVLPSTTETYNGHHELLGEPENALQLGPMQAGDVCIFDRNTLHRSLRNESERDRFAYAAQYCEVKGRCANSGQRMAHKLSVKELTSLYEEQLTAEPAMA